MKVLIIGLDGATWDVLDDFLLENHMPNLRKLKCDGYSGVLQSTEPPVTPAAWTTFLTGCNPSTHGIIGFQEYSFKTNSLSILNSTHCRVPNLWQELSRQGYKVASINVPWTYPCPEVNGITVAGYGCPGPESQFTFPGSFKDELLGRIPDYDIMAKCDWSSEDNFAKFDNNVERVEHSFQQKLEAARLVSEKINWDVLMVEFHDTDRIHHNIWAYVGKDSRDRYRQQRDRLFNMFERLDKIIGELLDCGTAKEMLVVAVSDHGGGRLIGTIRPNVLLHKWGYLKFKSFLIRKTNRQLRRWSRKFHSLSGQKKTAQAGSKQPKAGSKQPKELDIDWKRSKAVVIHTATLNGYVYVNLKGRQPWGCVQPGTQYNNIIEDLKKRFSEMKDPVTSQPLFRRVVTPAELYGPDSTVPEHVGDLVLIPQPGYDIATSTSRRKGYLQLISAESPIGTHRYEGIYIFSGTKVKAASGKQANIVDIAPTVYAALGAKLPTYLDGRVLHEAFVENLNIEYLKGEDWSGLKTAERRELSPEEQAAISQRLAEMGYL